MKNLQVHFPTKMLDGNHNDCYSIATVIMTEIKRWEPLKITDFRNFLFAGDPIFIYYDCALTYNV